MERHIFFHPNEVCSFDSAIRLDCRHIHKSWMSNITFWDQRFLFIFPFTLPSWLQRTFQVVGLRLLWMIRETIKRWLIKLCGLGKKKKKSISCIILENILFVLFMCVVLHISCPLITLYRTFFSGYSEYSIDIVPLSYLTKKILYFQT